MRRKEILLILVNIFAISLLLLFLVGSSNEIKFIRPTPEKNLTAEYNFTGISPYSVQFYKNMRFKDNLISYKIAKNCPITKIEQMEGAFKVLSNKTSLRFYLANTNEEILVRCEDKDLENGDLFLAGEGGPTSIVNVGEFNIILKGEILLIKDSPCKRPNIATHELLHVLGFNHSSNSDDLMYPISKCKQTINNKVIDKINELYKVSTLPDLFIENASAGIDGRTLDINISVKNGGLNDAKPSIIKIYADDKLVKEMPLEEIELGNGVKIRLENLWLKKIKINKIEIIIESNFEELSDENNKIVLFKEN